MRISISHQWCNVLISNLSFYDNAIILIYFAVVLAIGIIASFGKDKSSLDYFLAGRNVGWLVVGISLFTTNISSEHLIGLAGAGSIRGLSVGHFEWLAAFILVLLGWVFAPLFIRSNVYTMPEFLGKRFDERSRAYLTGVSLGAYFFTKIAVTLLAGGYLLSHILGLDMFFAAVLIVLFTGVYTVVGGLNSVLRTQVFQIIILLTGSLLLTIYGLIEVGGFTGLTSQLPDDYFVLFKPVSDPDFPWTGILFGAPILGIWYWCTDQYIVQRILSAKGIKDARKGTLLAAFLKTIPIFLFIIPGLIAAVLYPSVKGDEAFPVLIAGNLLPSGIKGLVIAGLFAALMSSLSSAFNSSATLITNDIIKPRRPQSSDHELVLVGRLATTIMVLIAISIIPILKMINTQIYIYLQNIQAYISPPIASVFLIGIFWPKATSRGAFWALIIGGSIGLLRIIISFFSSEFIHGIPVLDFINSINYLHFAIILFLLSSSVLMVISFVERRHKSFELLPSKWTFNISDLKLNQVERTKSKYNLIEQEKSL